MYNIQCPGHQQGHVVPGNSAEATAQSHTEGYSVGRGQIIACFLNNPNGMVNLLLLITSSKFHSL